MARAAYYLFRLHHVMPSEFYRMDYGERIAIHAFLDYEIEQRQKEYELIDEG